MVINTLGIVLSYGIFEIFDTCSLDGCTNATFAPAQGFTSDLLLNYIRLAVVVFICILQSNWHRCQCRWLIQNVLYVSDIQRWDFVNHEMSQDPSPFRTSAGTCIVEIPLKTSFIMYSIEVFKTVQNMIVTSELNDTHNKYE